jgi:ABC-type sugar transport system permease subunit
VFLIVYARLQGLPGHVLEAAQVDGAGRWATFRNITLPLIAPAIAFAAIFRAIDAFRSFDLVFGLTYGGPARSTTTLSFLTYQSGFQFQQYGYSAAIAYVMVVILICATTITLRFDPRLLARIKRIARSRYLNYQSMIKQWLSERLEQEMRE